MPPNQWVINMLWQFFIDLEACVNYKCFSSVLYLLKTWWNCLTLTLCPTNGDRLALFEIICKRMLAFHILFGEDCTCSERNFLQNPF